MCHLILFLPVFALPIFWLLPLEVAIPIYMLVLMISFLFYFKVVKAMTLSPRSGKEGMLGKTGIVLKDINPEGKIRYGLEIWSAVSDSKSFSAGEYVVIKSFDGMHVLVDEDDGKGTPAAISPRAPHCAFGRHRLLRYVTGRFGKVLTPGPASPVRHS